MFSQPSQPSQTYTRFREGEDPEPESGRQESTPAASTPPASTSANQRLLQEVLGETLLRSQEHPGKLIEHLKAIQQEHAGAMVDEQLYVLIAREVLRHRLGTRCQELPADLHEEIGRALWTNESSRDRIRRFWDALGAGGGV